MSTTVYATICNVKREFFTKYQMDSGNDTKFSQFKFIAIGNIESISGRRGEIDINNLPLEVSFENAPSKKEGQVNYENRVGYARLINDGFSDKPTKLILGLYFDNDEKDSFMKVLFEETMSKSNISIQAEIKYLVRDDQTFRTDKNESDDIYPIVRVFRISQEHVKP